MHYRNGREAHNGDEVVQLQNGKIAHVGVLHAATPGNDYCNGLILPISQMPTGACMVDCLHIDDVAEILAQAGLGMRPAPRG